LNRSNTLERRNSRKEVKDIRKEEGKEMGCGPSEVRMNGKKRVGD
jgi:hypothetical protein